MMAVDRRIITVAQMRAIDQASVAAGVPIATLMDNAGAAVARAAMKHFLGQRFDVLCGPGDNGGDGFVAARVLRAAGADVRVMALADAQTTPAAQAARTAWDAGVDPAHPDALRPESVVIDALFGAGLTRPLSGTAVACVHALGARPVVSVDVPSGLPGDGGPPEGPCVRASRTVTFVRKKPAHVLMPGLDLCGLVEVADIGAPASAMAGLPIFAEEVDAASLVWPKLARDAHKHARGRVCIVAGAAGASLTFGAQRLAAIAALRVGAGWVTAAVEGRDDAAWFTTPMSLMCSVRADLDLTRYNALVYGPGTHTGLATDNLCTELCALGVPMVVDGGAIAASTAGRMAPGSVLTPHAGEFARAFPECAAGVKIERARAAAQSCRSVVVFKGPDTVIAAPDGRVRVHCDAPPSLATAGTGDVLAGAIAGLIAQGLSAFDAATLGVWAHAQAAWLVGSGLIADDLPSAIARVQAGAGSPKPWPTDCA